MTVVVILKSYNERHFTNICVICINELSWWLQIAEVVVTLTDAELPRKAVGRTDCPLACYYMTRALLNEAELTNSCRFCARIWCRNGRKLRADTSANGPQTTVEHEMTATTENPLLRACCSNAPTPTSAFSLHGIQLQKRCAWSFHWSINK